MKQLVLTTAIAALLSAPAFAQDDQLEDMSDPLAVYTQAGMGYTDKGLNIKVGRAYDTGIENVAAMTVFEVKGFTGDTLGWRDEANDSIDEIRVRNFRADLTNGRGSQVDASYNFNNEAGSVSYSFLQALPKMGPVQLFPLAGLGLAVANDVDRGYEIPGAFAVIGVFGKLEITDKIWLNYNPMYMSALSGSEVFKNMGFEGDSSVLMHEFAASYQFTPRFNMRYFANWSENTDYNDGGHRIEFNYQF
ncbi:hypothetical protein [Ferrimonas pelagia]|uniref:Lipoprotein n=1 Tax=Ferrimonas pelagia TaxID=1177826 RepID=A0ABP9F522_9GAMM